MSTSKETLFLKVFESICIKVLKSKKEQQEDFFYRLILIMAYDNVALQGLISKFFSSFLGEACKNFLEQEKTPKPKKTPFFSLTKLFSAKTEKPESLSNRKDPALFISEQKSTFASKIFEHYEKKGDFLKLLSTILAFDIKGAKEETLLRTDSLSTYLAHIAFKSYLQKPLSYAIEKLEKINAEETVEKQASELIQCGIDFLKHLSQQEFIKTISCSVQKTVSEKFPEPEKKEKIIRNILTNLIFLRTTNPYILNSKLQMSKFFAKLLTALAYKHSNVIDEMPIMEIAENDSLMVQKDKKENNREAEQENPLRHALNMAYTDHYKQLSTLLDQLLFNASFE